MSLVLAFFPFIILWNRYKIMPDCAKIGVGVQSEVTGQHMGAV